MTALPSLYVSAPVRPVKLSRRRFTVRAFGMEKQQVRGRKLMEFPHLMDSHRDVMVDLISVIDNRLGSQLLPSSLSVPPDVEYYQNQSGSSQGSLCINRGVDSSPIDFILTSWLHLATPTGGSMDITNIQGYMKSLTDAPHFQFELVQCSPTYFLFFLDLTPRKDLVLHPDYLKTFYEDNQLEARRQKLAQQVPESKHFFSSSLYFRKVISPTGIMVSLNFEDGETRLERMEQVFQDIIGPLADEVMGIWMDGCVVKGRSVGEEERVKLEKRDYMIKSRAVEMDLSPNMPVQFGQQVADRFLGVIRSIFRI